MASNNKRKKSKSYTSRFVFLFMLLFISVIGINFYHQMQLYNQLKIEQKKLESQIEEQKQKTIELNNQKDYYNSDAYIEKIAREQLGLIKADERIFVNKSK